VHGLDEEAFAENEQAIFAVKYALLIISEAATRLGDEAAALQPDIPWREIRGIGNHLRHGYDPIDLPRIWRLIERDLPSLKAACQHALRILAAGSKPSS
jgi:uncharacterized protein with HEPN domain